jgi:hypothetical protein
MPQGSPNHAGCLTVSESTITVEVLAGAGLSLSQAARRFPPFRKDRPVAPSTIFRWIASGVRLRDGRRIRLEAVRLGGRWLTSEQAVQRFIDRQTPNVDADSAALARAPSQRTRRAEQAAEALEAAGI